MALFAISDLHLALAGDKPMDIFGEKWHKHEVKIKENWVRLVQEEDTVLLAGDLSWSMKIDDGLRDLEWLHGLPGKKIIIKGNHDYWWSSISKLNGIYKDISFIQNNFFSYEDYGICGTRGWTCPGGEKFNSHDEKIYKRELIRLRLSLDSAKNAGFTKLVVMLHYPPTNDKFEKSEFIEILQEYKVSKVIYGHLHGPSLNRVYEGTHEEIEYIVTSCDYIDFTPIKIF